MHHHDTGVYASFSTISFEWFSSKINNKTNEKRCEALTYFKAFYVHNNDEKSDL